MKNLNLDKSIFCMTGKVLAGEGKGKPIGMPTANMDISKQKCLPKAGVYAVLVEIHNKIYQGVTNVGKRPSVDDRDDITIEIYILDFDEDIYGVDIKIYFYKKLRSTRKMSSIKEVKKQVEMDVKKAKAYFAILHKLTG